MYRITLDLDKDTDQQVTEKVSKLHAQYPASRIDVIISPRAGVHIIVHSAVKTWDSVLKIREKYGDDPKRVKIDKQRKKNKVETQVLFTAKKGHESLPAYTIMPTTTLY